jgi:hypothetical protein
VRLVEKALRAGATGFLIKDTDVKGTESASAVQLLIT